VANDSGAEQPDFFSIPLDALPKNGDGEVMVWGINDAGDSLSAADLPTYFPHMQVGGSRGNFGAQPPADEVGIACKEPIYLQEMLNRMQTTARAYWFEKNPTKTEEDFDEEMFQYVWEDILPNLQSKVLDVSAFLNTLRVKDGEDLTFYRPGGDSQAVILPKRLMKTSVRYGRTAYGGMVPVEGLTPKLRGLDRLCVDYLEDLRPLAMVTPKQYDVFEPGQVVTIEWSSVPKIGAMLEQCKGINIQNAMLQIELMPYGRRCNVGGGECWISEACPFQAAEGGGEWGGSFEWTVPNTVRQGKYWVAARLMEGDHVMTLGADSGANGSVIEASGPAREYCEIITDPEQAATARALSENLGEITAEWNAGPTGPWACSICTMINEATSKICQICQQGTFMEPPPSMKPRMGGFGGW